MASNLNEVVDILNAKKFAPDLCILDFRMPGVKGYETFQTLREAYPSFSFAVMSGVAEESDIQKIIETGVSGYLPKTMPGRAILKAIDMMLNGSKYIPHDETSRKLAPSYFSDALPLCAATKEKPKSIVKLTNRETDVLKFLCKGLSNKDIADELNLKTVTVKLHIRGILGKLGCENRTSAALKAREMGIVD